MSKINSRESAAETSSTWKRPLGHPHAVCHTPAMLWREKPIKNAVIASHMNKFFKKLSRKERKDPSLTAQAYGWHLFDRRQGELLDEKRLARTPFHVGLGINGANFAEITKRSILVCDTLLLSHSSEGELWRLGKFNEQNTTVGVTRVQSDPGGPPMGFPVIRTDADLLNMRCPDLPSLGKWMLEAEPLLRADLAWYLPSYSVARETQDPGGRGFAPINVPVSGLMTQNVGRDAVVPSALDFLVTSGRAVTETGAQPSKSQVVRPVMQIDLPFIDGVDLRDFSKITVDEFASYSGFQDFLRQSFIDLDQAVDATHSERDLMKIGHQIKSEIRGIQSQMRSAKRKRAVAVTGAGIGTVGATLVAVYGPALQDALTILGAAGAGGVWGVIQSAMENSPRSLRDSEWYYVWALAQKSEFHG